MKWILVLLLGLLCASVPSRAGVDSTWEPEWRPLYDLVDPALQARLESRIAADPHWARLAAQERLSIGVVDLNGTVPRFARVNGNTMMYAASLPKIAILLAAYVALEDGSLPNRPEVRQDMRDMIRVSSNAAATRMIDRIGMQRIDDILMDPKYALYDMSRGGGLWVGKRYAGDGQRLGDPMHGISHGATVTQVCRYYYLLATGELVAPRWTEAMLADLSEPGIDHKFVHPLKRLDPEAELYRKSGTWKNWHADSVMVQGSVWRNYILVALIESPDGEKILRDLVPAVESVIQQSSTLVAQRI
jgi:beta-lactamase class A